jgi:hypothetical protein
MREGARKMVGLRRRAHLIDEEHGEICRVSADPLPGDLVGTRRSPSARSARRDDLVGKGGRDEGKQGEERPHVGGKRLRRKKKIRGGR